MLARASGRQLELPFDPLNRMEYRRQPRMHGFWALCIKDTSGRVRQETYPLEQMEFVLSHLRHDIDAGMSQAFFDNKTRRMIHVRWITCAFFDADLHSAPSFSGLTVDQAVGVILSILDDRDVPRPSVIINSGRGYHLKWFWTSPLPKAAAGKAVAVNRRLGQLLPELCPDPMAYAVSKTLRIVGTTNPRSGTLASIVWVNSSNKKVITYDFNLFADKILPFTRAEIAAMRAAKAAGNVHHLGGDAAHRETLRRAINPGWKTFCPEHWHGGVLTDITRLAEDRHNGTVPWGSQDTFGFLAACQIAGIVRDHPDLWHEISAFCRSILPDTFVQGPFRSFCSTLMERARLDAAGQMTVWNGKEVSNVYTYSRDRLIELLHISSDEMVGLQCLIDTDEKNRRKRAKHQAKPGTTGLDREGYLASGMGRPAEPPNPERLALAVRAKALFDAGATWPEVAKALEMKSAQAARKLAERAIIQGLLTLR